MGPPGDLGFGAEDPGVGGDVEDLPPRPALVILLGRDEESAVRTGPERGGDGPAAAARGDVPELDAPPHEDQQDAARGLEQGGELVGEVTLAEEAGGPGRADVARPQRADDPVVAGGEQEPTARVEPDGLDGGLGGRPRLRPDRQGHVEAEHHLVQPDRRGVRLHLSEHLADVQGEGGPEEAGARGADDQARRHPHDGGLLARHPDVGRDVGVERLVEQQGHARQGHHAQAGAGQQGHPAPSGVEGRRREAAQAVHRGRRALSAAG